MEAELALFKDWEKLATFEVKSSSSSSLDHSRKAVIWQLTATAYERMLSIAIWEKLKYKHKYKMKYTLHNAEPPLAGGSGYFSNTHTLPK